MTTIDVDETASRGGHRYVTVFFDMQRKYEPMIFAIPEHGKATLQSLSAFLAEHGGDPDNMAKVI